MAENILADMSVNFAVNVLKLTENIKGIPVFSSIAESSYVADVNGQKWEGGDKWWRNIFYLALGFLGL